MKIHLVDATYELFRAHFGSPPAAAPDGRPTGAVRGFIQTMLALLAQPGVTHVACAFDHVIESFRNDLFDGYKDGSGVPQVLAEQFDTAEEAAAALGLVVWPMVEFEADDAIATAVHRWKDHPEVDQIVICSPDKDMTQLVQGDKVVCLDRRRGLVVNEDAVVNKFGVPPESIPDYLALVGDSADGIPGVPRWGAKSTAQVLARYAHVESVPEDAADWDVSPRGAASMARQLTQRLREALLYRSLATLRADVPLTESLDDLRWEGVPRRRYTDLCRRLGLLRLLDAPARWSE